MLEQLEYPLLLWPSVQLLAEEHSPWFPLQELQELQVLHPQPDPVPSLHGSLVQAHALPRSPP